MIIVEENFEGRGLVHTYSDNPDKVIRQIETGEIYSDAIDIPGMFTYEECDPPVEEQPEEQSDDETEENNEN